MKTLHKRISAALLLLLSGIIFFMQLFAWYDVTHSNSLISELSAGRDQASDEFVNAAPEVLLARALAFKKHKRYDDALATMSLIANQHDPKLQALIRYNLGNIYLEQAVVKTEAMAINDAMPLLALAKQAYKQALMIDSGFWDAKYNLEVALRLLPEMDRINVEDESVHKKNAQLWTTVPGFPRGLP